MKKKKKKKKKNSEIWNKNITTIHNIRTMTDREMYGKLKSALCSKEIVIPLIDPLAF